MFLSGPQIAVAIIIQKRGSQVCGGNNRMSNLRHLAAIWYFPVDLLNHLRSESHQSHRSTYAVMRKSYGLSRGWTRRFLRGIFRLFRPFRGQPLATIGEQEILEKLRKDGIVVVEKFLPTKRVSRIKEFFDSQPHTSVSATKDVYSPDTILLSDEIRSLIEDPFLLRIAGHYLGCVPIFTGVAAWRSLYNPSATKQDLNKAAQLYHYDFDWPAFVKFFIYLTDVGEKNGPFTYVVGTHEKKAHWHDGRVEDDYIESRYSGRQKRVTGSAGDLIIADTVGYHKGEPVSGEPRLILQIEFAATRLGSSCQYDLLPISKRPTASGHSFDVFAK